MVPASSLDPTLLKSLQPTGYNMEEQYQSSLQQHKQAMQHQPACQQQCCTLPVVPPGASKIKPKKSESQPVKSSQKKTTENVVTAQKLSKKLKKAEEVAAKQVPVKEVKPIKTTKKEDEKKVKESNKSKAVVKQNSKEEIKPERKDVKTETKSTKVDSNKSKTKTSKDSDAVKEQNTRHVYEIDPEFKINKFGVLDTDEYSDVESNASDMHRSPVHKIEVPPKDAPKQPVQVKNKQKVETMRVEKVLPEGKKVKRMQESIPAKVAPEEPANLSKKQKKKLMQQEKNAKLKADAKGATDKNVTRAEKVAKSLSKSMLKLHLNADTTIELVNDCKNLDQVRILF